MSLISQAVTATGAAVAEVEAEIREAIVFHLEGLREDGLPICWVPCDHVPVRSWPLFRARQLMRDVIESFKKDQGL